jgi:hypothetical protein
MQHCDGGVIASAPFSDGHQLGLHRTCVVISNPPQLALEIGLQLGWRTHEAIPRVHLVCLGETANLSRYRTAATRSRIKVSARHTSHLSCHACGPGALRSCCIRDHPILSSCRHACSDRRAPTRRHPPDTVWLLRSESAYCGFRHYSYQSA